MIAKEHHAIATTDRFQRAGDEAEKQMAFYLRRAFADDPGIHVFHNLRLEAGDDAAQIDHLLLHRSGAVIVESKSVTSTVRINERDEWTRNWNGRWTGMPSPVLQAKRQADFLRKSLQDRREELRGKAVFGLVQKGFRALVIDVVVAISDGGVIQYRGQLPEVLKADQVVDRARELMQEQARLAHPLSRDPRSKDWGITFKPDEFVRVSAFLRAAHRDRVAQPDSSEKYGNVAAPVQTSGKPASQPAVRPAPETSPVAAQVYEAVGPVKAPAHRHAFACQKCSSATLEVAYGKYGYYFRCLACEGNTRIELKCPGCGERAKTRESGCEFFAECAACKSSQLYFTNPA